jgi:hypothetical protein
MAAQCRNTSTTEESISGLLWHNQPPLWLINSSHSALRSKHPRLLLQRATAGHCVGKYSPPIVKPRSDDLHIWQPFEIGGYLPRHGNDALVQIMATSPPPTQLSVAVTQIKLNTNVCISSWDLFLLSHDSLMPSKQTNDFCRQSHSVHRVAHIHEPWERDDDQANILQVCRNTNVCHINRSWERYGNYWLGSL